MTHHDQIKRSPHEKVETLDQLYDQILTERKGRTDAVGALFAIELAKEALTNEGRRVWLLSIDGLTSEQHDTIYRLTR